MIMNLALLWNLPCDCNADNKLARHENFVEAVVDEWLCVSYIREERNSLVDAVNNSHIRISRQHKQ